jgi:hypothetical protein
MNKKANKKPDANETKKRHVKTERLTEEEKPALHGSVGDDLPPKEKLLEAANKTKTALSFTVLVASWLAIAATFLTAVGYLYASGYLMALGIDHDQFVRPAHAYAFKVLFVVDFWFSNATFEWSDLFLWASVIFLVTVLAALTAQKLVGLLQGINTKTSTPNSKKILSSTWWKRWAFAIGYAALVAVSIVAVPMTSMLLLFYVITPVKTGEAAAIRYVTEFVTNGGCDTPLKKRLLVGTCVRLVNTSAPGVSEVTRGLQLAASEKYVALLAENVKQVNGTSEKNYEVRVIQFKDTMSLLRDVVLP